MDSSMTKRPAAHTVSPFLCFPPAYFLQVHSHVTSGKNPRCPISHLANRLKATQITGFSCIVGNLFPATSSSVISIPKKTK